MRKILPHVKDELSHQKFAVKRLKTVAAQNQAQVQSEFKTVQEFVQDAIASFSQSLPCDGSCVHIRQKLKGKALLTRL